MPNPNDVIINNGTNWNVISSEDYAAIVNPFISGGGGGGGGGGNTNLSYQTSGSNGIVLSDTGTDAIIPLATTSLAGLLSPADKTLLNNTSNINTGDETTTTILTKIGNGSLISSTYLPSYVDDILEYADFSSFPIIGESGKIYISQATNLTYRWTGSIYIQVGGSSIILTTTGNSGAATLISGTLNIPIYQTQINGTGFVKATGTTISYDNSTYLTANQTITLSGEVSGSGTTAITTTINNDAVISKVLTGYVSGTGVITATDTILTAIQKLNANSIYTGTSNRITITSNVIDISSAYIGQSSITTLGTITTGVWNGISIVDTYISSATNWNSAYSNRITSLTTTGNSGSSTLISNVLNIPTYTLAGLGGQPQLNGSGWVKASGTTISYANNLIFDTTTSLPSGDGFYSPAANVVGVVINGIEVARWNSTNYQVVSTVAVSGNIFDLTINSTVTTGNANININSNQANALNFKDSVSNDYLRFCTTTSNFKITAMQQFELTKSLKQSVTNITSNITLDLNHRIIYVDATSNNVTITLPNPTITIYTNIEYEIKRIDNSIFVVTVQTNTGTVFINDNSTPSIQLGVGIKTLIRNRTATQWQTF